MADKQIQKHGNPEMQEVMMAVGRSGKDVTINYENYIEIESGAKIPGGSSGYNLNYQNHIDVYIPKKCPKCKEQQVDREDTRCERCDVPYGKV